MSSQYSKAGRTSSDLCGLGQVLGLGFLICEMKALMILQGRKNYTSTHLKCSLGTLQ